LANRYGISYGNYSPDQQEFSVEAKDLSALAKDQTDDKINRVLSAHFPCLLPIAPQLALAACHDMPVLFTGETGTGKTFLARLVHECSQRGRHPFLVVPCGAMTANLIESELFGHSRGAFTGATQSKLGKFSAAGAGTIVLDEIDLLELDHQAKLLRVLDTGEYEPVGSNRTLSCQARIIAVSNIDLEEAIHSGKFREDLFFRLNVLRVHLAPLRERKAEIPGLALQMVRNFSLKFGKPVPSLSVPVWRALEDYPWPGNIRQLENILQTAVLLCRGSEILLTHLPESMVTSAGKPR
jgi:two-component system, NtrC family, response regulator HydG